MELPNPTAGNVLANNGNGTDTLNGTDLTIDLVTLTITTPAAAINGGNVPTIQSNFTGTVVVVPQIPPAGSYTIVYQICDNLSPTNFAVAQR
jgi:hypothetical protein